jgi:hypothetical protein
MISDTVLTRPCCLTRTDVAGAASRAPARWLEIAGDCSAARCHDCRALRRREMKHPRADKRAGHEVANRQYRHRPVTSRRAVPTQANVDKTLGKPRGGRDNSPLPSAHRIAIRASVSTATSSSAGCFYPRRRPLNRPGQPLLVPDGNSNSSNISSPRMALVFPGMILRPQGLKGESPIREDPKERPSDKMNHNRTK